MKCPRCESRYLAIDIVFAGKVSCKFLEKDDLEEFELLDTLSMNSQWDDHSECSCLSCEWQGKVQDARSQSGSGTPSTHDGLPFVAAPSCTTVEAATSLQLQQLRDEIRTKGCDSHWRTHIENLIAEVERLDALLEAMMRVSEKDKRDNSGQDTVVG